MKLYQVRFIDNVRLPKLPPLEQLVADPNFNVAGMNTTTRVVTALEQEGAWIRVTITPGNIQLVPLHRVMYATPSTEEAEYKLQQQLLAQELLTQATASLLPGETLVPLRKPGRPPKGKNDSHPETQGE